MVVSYPLNGIQNGAPDGIALVRPDATVEQFLGYEGTFTATNGPASRMTTDPVGVSEDGTTPAGWSLQLTGTGLAYGDFTWAAPAANTSNCATGQVFDDPNPPESECGFDATLIHDVQGSEPPAPWWAPR